MWPTTPLYAHPRIMASMQHRDTMSNSRSDCFPVRRKKMETYFHSPNLSKTAWRALWTGSPFSVALPATRVRTRLTLGSSYSSWSTRSERKFRRAPALILAWCELVRPTEQKQQRASLSGGVTWLLTYFARSLRVKVVPTGRNPCTSQGISLF